MNKNFTRLFIKFLMPYICIMMIMFSLTYIIYYVSTNEIENNAIKMQEAYMKQSQSILDQRFQEVFDMAVQIKNIPYVEALKQKSKEDLEKNYIYATSLFYQLKDVLIVNEIVEGYYIFYKNSQIAASSSTITYYNQLHKNNFYSYKRNREELWELLFEQYYNNYIMPEENMIINGKKVRGIPVINTIGYKFNDPEAAIVIILNADKLRESILGFKNKAIGNFIIANDDDKVLLSLNKKIGINTLNKVSVDNDEDDYMTFDLKSDVTDFKYILIQLEENVFKDIESLKWAGQILILIIFIIGLSISYVSARYNSKPIKSLIQNNETLNKKLKEQRPHLRRTLLERWLKGTYTNIDEIILITKYLKAKYIGDLYLVFVINYNKRIDVFDELDEKYVNDLEIKRMLIKDILTQDILLPEYIHDIDNDKIATIFISYNKDKELFLSHVREKIEKCRRVLQQNNISEVTYGVGLVYDNMEDVSTSLSNALDAIATIGPESNNDIVWYSDIEKQNDNFYYPQELETRLLNFTITGEVEQVEQLLRTIIKRNIFEKSLSNHMIKIFIYEMIGTLSKIREKTSVNQDLIQEILNPAFEKLDSMNDLEKIQCCRKLFLNISKEIHKENEHKHNKLMKEIYKFIEENFKDPNFGLPIVAEHFGISYAYLSQIFKENSENNFMNYLQTLRMNEAKRLLRETDMPVKDIVAFCGYNSSNTFGKAFKRIHGVSASVYRNKYKSVNNV